MIIFQTIVNLYEHISSRVPDFPNEPEKGEHEVVFQSPFYIERDDWRAEAERGYRWVADFSRQADCISG